MGWEDENSREALLQAGLPLHLSKIPTFSVGEGGGLRREQCGLEPLDPEIAAEWLTAERLSRTVWVGVTALFPLFIEQIR